MSESILEMTSSLGEFMNWIPTQEKVHVGGRTKLNTATLKRSGQRSRIDVALVYAESEEQL